MDSRTVSRMDSRISSRMVNNRMVNSRMVNRMVNNRTNNPINNPINNRINNLTSNPTIRHIANPTTKRPTLQNRTIRGLQATRCLRSGEMTVRSKVLSRSVPLASCSALELI